jgi:hypothetical protein
VKSGLRGNPRNLREFGRTLQELPKVLAQRIATRVAPELTTLARSAYTSGRTVYGDARPRGLGGHELDLVVKGDTLARVRFVAIGTVVRCVLGTRHARYLIGKYRILPMGKLPALWSQTIGDATRDEIRRALP